MSVEGSDVDADELKGLEIWNSHTGARVRLKTEVVDNVVEIRDRELEGADVSLEDKDVTAGNKAKQKYAHTHARTHAHHAHGQDVTFTRTNNGEIRRGR